MKVLLVCATMLLAGTASAQIETNRATGAVLRALDKLSGDVVDITMKAGTLAQFGRLEIVLTECRFPKGNPSGDAFAGLQIRDTGRGTVIFAGWMVASSPGLSPMEHPRYDVWVMRCTLT